MSLRFCWSARLLHLPALGALVVGLALGSAPTRVAHAAGISVTTTVDELNSDGDCSLREAVRAANLDTAVDACPAGSGADTITLPAGTYTRLQSGELVITAPLTIAGAGASTTIIDANRIGRVFDVSATARISGVTIRNGSLYGEFDGGGIHNSGNLTLDSTVVSGSSTEEGLGGGIYNDGTLTILNSTITDNTTTDAGGGITNEGTMTISHSTVSDNYVAEAIYGQWAGGGIDNSGTATINDSLIVNNIAHGGGGIYNAGRLELNRTIVRANYSGTGAGGGVYNSGGTARMIVRDSQIIANSAGVGGGFLNEGRSVSDTGAALHLVNSRIADNQATQGSGGGIFSRSDVTITDTTIINNSAITGGGGISADVGGVPTWGSLSLTGSTVAGNRADDGRGGGIRSTAALTITRSTIRDNVADDGGGVWHNPADPANALTINDSTISGNQAIGSGNFAGGGGISLFTVGDSRITNTTISGNSTEDEGGGLRASIEGGGNVYLRNVTVTKNTGGGGLFHEGNIDRTPDLSTVFLANTLVAGNTSAGYPYDCFGFFSSQGYNLITHPGDCQISGNVTGNLLGVDPLLGPLQNNGGPTATYALLPGSPAIDAGNPATPGSSATACPATDQRGVARPQGFADTARCDIGAFERQGGANLLLNGSFEADSNNDGTPDGWSADSRVRRSSAVVRSGQYALRHQASDNASYTIFSDSVGGIVPGQLYSAVGWVNIPATSDSFSIELQVRWRDANNNVISTVPIKTFSAATSGWSLASAALIAPPNAALGSIRMVVTSLNATIYVDDVSLQQTANRLGNSGFEQDTAASGWSYNAYATRSNAVVHSGAYALRHQASDNASYTIFSDSIPSVVAGRPYSVGGWVNIPATSDSFSIEFQLRWRDAAGNVISTVPVKTFSAATGGWTSFSASLIAPPNAAQANLRQVVSSLNATIYVDDLTLGP